MSATDVLSTITNSETIDHEDSGQMVIPRSIYRMRGKILNILDNQSALFFLT